MQIKSDVQTERSIAERHISVPKPLATGNPVEWFQKFEICSKANNWNAETMAVKLPTLLEGEALAIWLELSEDEQKDYKEAKKKLVATMTPAEFVSLDEFHLRKMHPGEAISLFLHDLKRLLGQAMPKLEANAREQVLLYQFLAGLPESVSSQLRATGETKSQEDTVERARLLMTISSKSAHTTAAIMSSPTEVKELKEQIAELTQQVAALTTQKPSMFHRRQQVMGPCFGCGQLGHLQCNCPNQRSPPRNRDRRPCWACGQPEHVARDCQQGSKRRVPAWGNRHPLQQ